jgi:invasion protein IalB
MPLATRRLARTRRPIGLIAAAAFSVGFSAGALAQTDAPAPSPAAKPKAAAPAAKKPAAAPAAPAASPAAQAPSAVPPAGGAAPGGAAAGGAAGQNGNGPTIVQVKSEPSQADWTKVCGKDPNANTEICYTTRDFVSDQGQPVLAAAVYDVKGGPNGQNAKVVRFLMPLGLMLRPGIRFGVDQGQPTPGQYALCFPNGCFAEAPVKDETIAAMKKGTSLNVSVQNQVGREVTFAVPLEGFGKAFDGPAVDPKVLEEQQKKLQSELEKRSDDLRKKLEQNAGSTGTTTPAPAPGATSAAAPK